MPTRLVLLLVFLALLVGLLLGAGGGFLAASALVQWSEEPAPPQPAQVYTAQMATATPAPTPTIAVPQGMRAMSFKIAPDGLMGFIVPGARIDVLGKGPDPAKQDVQVVVQNVQVLAVNSQSNGQAMGEVTLTVALPPEDAPHLAAAMQLGPLQVALRRAEE